MSNSVIEAPAAAAPDIRMIPLKDLIPTPDNPRFIEHPDKLAELAANIKALGMLQPVVARPHPKHKGKFDLRAGFRRYQAAKLAGLAAIPVSVRELSDREAMDVTVAENMQREQLHPIEEAKGVQTLLDSGWTFEEIAARTGKSAASLCRRAALNRLDETWRKAFTDSDQVPSRWPAGVMELIARLAPATQAEVFKAAKQRFDADTVPTREDMEEWLQGDFVRLVDDMPWNVEDAALFPDAGACASCSKRTDCAAQRLLFVEDDAGEREQKPRKNRSKNSPRCLDAACYREKHRRHLVALVAAAKKEHGKDLVLVNRSHYSTMHAGIPNLHQKVVDNYYAPKASKKDKGAVPALVVAGDGFGTVQMVLRRKSWEEEQAARRRKEKAAAEKPRTLAQLRKELAERRASWIRDQLSAKLTKLEDAKDPMAELRWSFDDLVVIAAAFGSNNDLYGSRYEKAIRQLAKDRGLPEHWAAFEYYQANDLVAGEDLARGLIIRIGAEIDFPVGGQAHRTAAMERTADLLGLDFADLNAQAEKKFPEPKAWAKLNPDGTPQGITSGAKAGKSKPPAKKGKAAKGKKATAQTSPPPSDQANEASDDELEEDWLDEGEEP